MKRTMRLLSLMAALVLVAGACAASGDEDGSAEEEESSGGLGDGDGEDGASGGGGNGDFGDLSEVCGEGDLTIAEDENAGSAETLRIGVANDRTSQIRPGLQKELWDTSVAFVAWCNEQGGIGGLPVEIVDLDAKLLEVETAMTKACSGVFMMVGGGHVQDNLQFSDKPESDFHQCGLSDIPGFAVSPEKAGSNGQVQPLPNPSDEFYSGWLRDFAELEPENAESGVIVFGDLPSIEFTTNQIVSAMEAEGVTLSGMLDYPVTGLSDWTPLAQQVIATGGTSLHFVGEPTNQGTLMKTLREQGWEGTSISATNVYDQTLIDSAGAENAEGSIVRLAYHPFEEADDWPATRQFLDILGDYGDDAKIAAGGFQSFSAWLLFAEAAKACGSDNEGELTRECVLEAAADVEDWTGGGLHAPKDPGPQGGPASTCEMLVVVRDGAFERLFPEVGSDDDDGDGFKCHDDAVVEVTENEGLGVVDPDRPI